MKYFFIAFLITITSVAQNSHDIDSFRNKISNLSKQEQLRKILSIPYDEFVGDIKTSETLAEQAVNLALELNDSTSLAKAYLQLAQVYTYKDKRDKKVFFNLKAINIYEKLGELSKAGYAYGELGYSIKREDFKNALYYMRKGINLIENFPSATKIDATYDNYGILQGMAKKYDSALYYHNKSLVVKKENKDSIGIPYGYVHLATVHISLKEFNTAKKYIDSSHVIRLKRNDTYGVTDNYVYYGDLYFAQENYQLAIENFKKGYDLAIENNIIFLQKYCAEYLTKIYLLKNDYKNAFNFNIIHQTLKDSTLNAQTNSRVAELQIEFETEKKEKEIAQQKEDLLKNELELKNKNLTALLLGSGLLFFGIVSFGLYKRQQHKKAEHKNQLDLKEAQTYNKLQDQRLRISRDLHDNIGSQLTFIISSIDNIKFLTKKSNDGLKDKLTDINDFASDTIMQLRDTIWAMNKNEIPYEDFQTRVLSFIEKAKSATTNIQFNFDSSISKDFTFTSIKGINVFRIIQEAINNAIKYAEASEISVKIKENSDQILIEISDNGIGFDINTITPGNGLENMQKRILEIGGELQVNSKNNAGTSIVVKCSKNRTNAV